MYVYVQVQVLYGQVDLKQVTWTNDLSGATHIRGSSVSSPA